MASTGGGKRKRGRPSKRTKKLEEELLEHIASGRTLREFCREPGRPAFRTVYDWLGSDADFSARFAKSRKVGFDCIAEEALELVDAEPPKIDGKIDPGYVQWIRSRVWTRLQLLAKWDPGRYGNKVALAGDVDSPPIKISNEEAAREVAMLLATAAARKVQAQRKAEAEAVESDGNGQTRS